MTSTLLRGRVTSGVGEGARFMGLPWVTQAIRRAVGFDPYPGTLNVQLSSPAGLPRWREARTRGGVRLLPPSSTEACGARLVPIVVVPDVPAAVIIPDVTRYGEEMLEIVAAVHLRTRLRLRDGDVVTVSV